ncbi:hypothetical protein GCM10011385_28580 [Nitratireductor aestuarii]|uniref:Uncharacterized protein n=1 Tax=Nitratireductor aestuarii TaxID=1735103 RepID=A0A916RVQ6_9HYPH|nr:hypothetical protein GCM10011385_28580 [Nitratireductor aestuarii]
MDGSKIPSEKMPDNTAASAPNAAESIMERTMFIKKTANIANQNSDLVALPEKFT